MIRILKKEILGYFNSVIAYLVIGVFLVVMGLLVWVFPDTSVLSYGYADLDSLFSFGPYVLLFLAPAITMRLFADEEKLGTLELLMTKPLRDWDIILGKYISAILLLAFSLAPTLVYYFSVSSLGIPPGNIDTAGVAGSYIGLFLLGCVFLSFGLFASSLTSNQILSFIIGAFLSFFFYNGFDAISGLSLSPAIALMVEQTGILYHYQAMSKGLIDSQDLLYFIGLILVFLFLTKIKLGSRKW
jgi:ABC-2 type transport system permease protein